MASSAFLCCSIIAMSSIASSSTTTKLHHSSSAFRPTKVTMTTKPSNWATISTDVESHIDKAISGHEPAMVFEPMHHLTFAPPRSMAPALCVAACEVVGGQKDQAIAAASALHLIHAAAFTHENLPLSDRSNPMSKSTNVHHAFGPNIELLTGDGILPFGYELLGRSDDPTSNNSEKILRVIIEIARATGSQGLVEGQYQQMRCMGSDSGDDDQLCNVGWENHVCKKKEGGLFACGAACGAILGGGTDEEVETLRRFGFYVGMMHGMTMLHENGKLDEKKWKELVQEFRSLALKELESFKGKNIETLCSLVDECFTVTLGQV